MFKCRLPIKRSFINSGHTCILNQLYGENLLNIYGPEGHLGWDIKTMGNSRWVRDNTVLGGFRREERTQEEKDGFIPVIAAHDGELSTNFFYRAKQVGWGMVITHKENENLEYRTLYWHIESPWRSLAKWIAGMLPSEKMNYVRAGSIIAIAGNSGWPKYSSGPHLHFEIQRRERYNGSWSDWESVDPVPYMQDPDIIYQKYGMTSSRWFYQGEEVSPLKAKEIISNL